MLKNMTDIALIDNLDSAHRVGNQEEIKRLGFEFVTRVRTKLAVTKNVSGVARDFGLASPQMLDYRLQRLGMKRKHQGWELAPIKSEVE